MSGLTAELDEASDVVVATCSPLVEVDSSLRSLLPTDAVSRADEDASLVCPDVASLTEALGAGLPVPSEAQAAESAETVQSERRVKDRGVFMIGRAGWHAQSGSTGAQTAIPQRAHWL